MPTVSSPPLISGRMLLCWYHNGHTTSPPLITRLLPSGVNAHRFMRYPSSSCVSSFHFFPSPIPSPSGDPPHYYLPWRFLSSGHDGMVTVVSTVIRWLRLRTDVDNVWGSSRQGLYIIRVEMMVSTTTFMWKPNPPLYASWFYNLRNDTRWTDAFTDDIEAIWKRL